MIYLLSILLVLSVSAVIYLYRLLYENKINNKSLLEQVDMNRSDLDKIKQQIVTSKNEYDGVLQNISIGNEKFSEISNKTNKLVALENNRAFLANEVERLMHAKSEHENAISELIKQRDEIDEEIFELKRDLSIFQEIANFNGVGLFEEPKYLFEISASYQVEIKRIREQQKDLIRSSRAIEIPEFISSFSDQSIGQKVIKGQARMMIESFNIECDNLLQQLKISSYSAILEKIEKYSNDLEKNAASLKCSISEPFLELKFKECELVYQYKLMKQKEEDEQAEIKERMREEQKAQIEYDRLLSKAKKEEEIYRLAIERAKVELNTVVESEKQVLINKIKMLEKQLQDAEENERRAISMAEQTKRGYVYVISNIGSFGENIYKIGLTRRLEPMDRVNELSGASVPFSFDVHAVILSDDAPALEAKLHRELATKRVNQINQRKRDNRK